MGYALHKNLLVIGDSVILLMRFKFNMKSF